MPEIKQVGRYKLLAREGQGDLLNVYRAHDLKRDQPVILKLLHPHLQDDARVAKHFCHQAERLARLQQAHIVPVCDVGTQDHFYLVTGIPPGISLAQHLASHGPLEIDDLLSVITQLAQALDYAHGQGIYHHDVRPSNIYLQDEHVWLDNFYLLEAVGAPTTYVAPEQVDPRNFGAADHRSDTYALAVMLYEMLTGKPPFEGSREAVMQAHLTQRPKVPRAHRPDLLPALDAILLKALTKRPESRYQTANALANALHEAVQGAQTRLMTDSGVFSRKAMAMQRKKSSGNGASIPTWAWVGGGVLLAVVVSVVILLATA